MGHWSVLYQKIFILALVFLPACFPGFASAVPSPCDQLESAELQALCARFLADTESSGGQSFAAAATADGLDGLKSRLEDDKNYAGLILLLTNDIDIMGKPMLNVIPRGIVALLGNPVDPPRINLVGEKGERTTVYLAPDPKIGATIKPQAFYCWGVEWLLGDRVRNAIFVYQHYGPVHITHSIFAYTMPIKTTINYPYIEVSLEDTPDQPVSNSILIAHNQFMNMPADYLGDYGQSNDINIYCLKNEPNSREKQADSTCHRLGDVVITGNIWQSPPELAAEEFFAGDSQATPSPFGPYPYRFAVMFADIAKATFSKNSAADKDAVLSVIFQYNFYPYTPNEFDNLNLQLVNNVAMPEMNATHRQFYLNGLTVTGKDLPVAGLVNMTCNPDFNVVRTGSFAHNSRYNLTIIQANDDCAGPTVTPTTAPPTTVPTPVTSTLPASSLITSVLTTLASPSATATATIIGSVSSVLPSISATPTASGSPVPYPDSQDKGAEDKIIIYSASAAGFALALTVWEATWISVYRFSSGKTRNLAGAMALFIPFCLRYLLSRKTARLGYSYTRVPTN